MMQDMCNPQIMSLYDILHDNEHFYVVTELYPSGNLYHLITRNMKQGRGSLQEKEVQNIGKQLFQSLKYLHQNDIVHGDIRLENVLFKDQDDVAGCSGASLQKSIKLIEFK